MATAFVFFVIVVVQKNKELISLPVTEGRLGKHSRQDPEVRDTVLTLARELRAKEVQQKPCRESAGEIVRKPELK